MTDETVELVKRVARRRLSGTNKFDRYMRAMDEAIDGESREEREKRLTELHWALFDEAPPFNPSAPRPDDQVGHPRGEG